MAVEKDLMEKSKMPIDVLPEDVELEAQDLNPSDDMNISMTEDGGAEIDFDPQAEAMQGAEQHDANLADFLEEDDLNVIAGEILEEFDECASSRDEWEQTYKKGLDGISKKLLECRRKCQS